MVRLQREAIERIHTLRLRRNWSMSRLAREAGMLHTHVVHILSGKHGLTLFMLDRLEKALGAPILAVAGRPAKQRKADPIEPINDEFDSLLKSV